MADQPRPPWAVKLRAEREARGWGKWDMARHLLGAADITHHDPNKVKNLARQILSWEKGDHFPRDWATAYATALDIPEHDLFPDAPSPRSSGVSVGTVKSTADPDDWGEMERRRLLLAALGLTAGALSATGEPIRQLLAQALACEPRTIEAWHLTYIDHRHSLSRQSPAQVRDNLIIDLLAIQEQMTTAEARDVPELERIVAGLCSVQANVLTRLGEDGAAIRWWRTARAAADRSGDLDLRLMVRAEEAGCGLYGQRDLTTVLHLADGAQRIADGYARSGLVMSVCHRAKALALLGRREAAHQSLAKVSELAGGQAPPATYGYPDTIMTGSIHFAESWVYAHTGDEALADNARARVLSTPALDYQYATNVRLHEAQCTVVKGGIDRGVQQAAEILADLPAGQQSHVIAETAKTVLRAIPLEQQQRPGVREFREVLTKTAPKAALNAST